MDPITIAALIASTALSAYNSNQAAKRQQEQARQAMQRQMALRNQATDEAMKHVQEYDPGTRKANQDTIEQGLTKDYTEAIDKPQITAQGVQVGTTLPDGQGGDDYLKTKAREAVKTQTSLRALASLLGRTGSASELRRQEGYKFGDTAGNIGRIQDHAGVIGEIDNNIRIPMAGQPSLGLSLASAALGSFGMGRALGGFGAGGQALGGGGANPMFPQYGMASGATGGWV